MITLTFLLIGAIEGFIASRLMNENSGLIKNMLLGIVGSFVGGYLFNLLNISATGWFGNLITSVIGACICIWIGRKLFRKNS